MSLKKMVATNLAAHVFMIFSFVFHSKVAQAFPELIRYGFSTCATCHVSPNGGGILNSVGRTMSSSLLSRNFFDGEEAFLNGALNSKLPSWIFLGGDFRVLQSDLETQDIREGRFIMMEADVDAAINSEHWTAVASIGRQSIVSSPYKLIGKMVSRKHYFLYRSPSVKNLVFRAGRFYFPFGIRQPEHEISTKAGLGWNVDSETYNLEASYTQEIYDIFAALFSDRPDIPEDERERGIVFRTRRKVTPKTQIGLSYYFGTNEKSQRHVAGPLLITELSPNTYFLSEIDVQFNKINQSNKTIIGVVSYSKFGLNLTRGVWALGTMDYQKLNFKEHKSIGLSLGGGLQYFPRPHLEFEIMAESKRNPITQGRSSLFWLMAHYYL